MRNKKEIGEGRKVDVGMRWWLAVAASRLKWKVLRRAQDALPRIFPFLVHAMLPRFA